MNSSLVPTLLSWLVVTKTCKIICCFIQPLFYTTPQKAIGFVWNNKKGKGVENGKPN